jgi:hypothetical protein
MAIFMYGLSHRGWYRRKGRLLDAERQFDTDTKLPSRGLGMRERALLLI